MSISLRAKVPTELMYGMLVISANHVPGTVLRCCSLWSLARVSCAHSRHIPWAVCLPCRVASGVFICPVPPLAPYSSNCPDLSQFTDTEPLNEREAGSP